MKFKCLEQSLTHPWAPERTELDLTDWAKFGRPELLHVVMNGVLNFHAAHKRLPGLLHEEDANELVKMTKEYNESAKSAEENKEGRVFVEEVDEKIVRNCALFA